MFKIAIVAESTIEEMNKLLHDDNNIVVSGRLIENIEYKTFSSIEDATNFIISHENNSLNQSVNYVIFKKEA